MAELEFGPKAYQNLPYHHFSTGQNKKLEPTFTLFCPVNCGLHRAVCPPSVALLQHRHGCGQNIVTLSLLFSVYQ